MRWAFVPIFLGLLTLIGWLGWLLFRFLMLKDPDYMNYLRSKNKDKK